MADACTNNVKGIIKCPFCNKSKNIVFKGTVGMSSSQCPICKRYIQYDYDHMSAAISNAIKGATQQLAY